MTHPESRHASPAGPTGNGSNGRPGPPHGYLPIEEHGIVGDLRTVALVGTDGTVDWYCPARFDAPSLFGALLDAKKGGYFSLWSRTAYARPKQIYLPDTNILLTRFLGKEAVGEVIDFMVPETRGVGRARDVLVRQARSVRGRVTFELACHPAFDYGRAAHDAEIVPGVGAVFTSSLGRAVLRADVPLKIEDSPSGKGPGVAAAFTLEEGQTVSFHLEWNGEVRSISDGETDDLHARTQDYWQGWLAQSRYRGRWREMVHRSALALKLLVYHPTGALVAAPTTSLPEEPGGTRNWDYRYSWLRDAAFTTYALMRLGFLEEAGSFMEWIQKRCETATKERDVMIMYTVDGSEELPELVLDHLDGYRGARPVRIGNGAIGQRQIDVYGELMDSVYLFNKEQPISYDLWVALSKRLDWLSRHWEEPDEGVWEIRGPRQRFTYSALMTWVAYERALRLARDRGLPAPLSKWRKLAASAYRYVQESCWDPALKSYVMYPGSSLLDASLLVMPLVRFSGPNDPRFLATLDRISAELTSDSLVSRYALSGVDGITGADGIAEGEGTFNLCSFWYVEALTRAGRVREARWVFEKMLTYANHLGLYAEQIGASGEALGNFPQAFTHLALISAAVNLDQALDKAR
jgi:GH15 family glucan-1,4-alpha-glucosidase